MMNFTHTGELTTEFIPSEILDFQAAFVNGEDAGLTARKENLETDPQIPEKDEDDLFRKSTEQDMIAQMLEMGVKKKQIAQKLSISRMTVYRKMKKYNLN
jgi:transcriptional regulator with PAS, ATPase and Fis domain